MLYSNTFLPKVEMNRILSGRVWESIAIIAKGSRSKRAAIAYVTDDQYVEFTDGDILVVDASRDAIRAGQTSARVLRRAYNRNVALYSFPGLHSKVLLLGGVAVVGSANASQSSASTLFETVLVSDQPIVVAGVTKAIAELVLVSTRITEKQLAALEDIAVVRSPFKARKAKLAGSDLKQPRTWLLGIYEEPYGGSDEKMDMVSERVAAAAGANAEDVAWFHWDPRSRFHRLAQPGDLIVEVWLPNHPSTKDAEVFRHAVLERRVRERGQKCDTFHCIWPSDWEKRALTWAAFKKLAARAGVRFDVTPEANCELAPNVSEALAVLWP